MSVSPRLNEYNQKLNELRSQYGVSVNQEESIVIDKDKQVVMLPQTQSEFKYLYDTVIASYQIEDNDMALYDFCEAIGSLPQAVDETTLGYLGKYLRRRIAHKVTYEVVEQVRAKFASKIAADEAAKKINQDVQSTQQEDTTSPEVSPSESTKVQEG